MNGRQEHALSTENQIKKIIEKSPRLLKEYSYNFGDNRSLNTKLAYIKYINHFISTFSNKDIKKITRTDINQYMEGIKYRRVDEELIENSVSIREAKLSAIKDFYQFLTEEGYIKTNPASNIKPPKCNEEKEIVALTPEEISIIKNNIINGVGSKRAAARQKMWINRDLAIVTLGFQTGLRCTAITEINIEDINFENNSIKVIEKGNVVKNVLLGEKTVDVIKDWIKDRNKMFPGIKTTALFLSNRGIRISQHSIAVLIKKYSYNIDKHVTPHKMRSSCATNLYDKTNDIYLVQHVLGHKNIANTKRYAKVSDEKKQMAAQILDNLY